MNKLSSILAHKKNELLERKELYPSKLLEQSPFFETPAVSLRQYLTHPDRVGVIAEIKRCSPSCGSLNPDLSVESLSIGYMQAGASALSILTDKSFFGGSNSDLEIARRFNVCPILRKDFIIDEYQVIESKSIGADVVLLIASALDPKQLKALAQLTHQLSMEVLIEVHSEEEISASPLELGDLIGINNRNLADFSVSLETSLRLRSFLPTDMPTVSESGIETAQDLQILKQAGFSGFLIGQRFLRVPNPEDACRLLINQFQRLNGHKKT